MDALSRPATAADRRWPNAAESAVRVRASQKSAAFTVHAAAAVVASERHGRGAHARTIASLARRCVARFPSSRPRGCACVRVHRVHEYACAACVQSVSLSTTRGTRSAAQTRPRTSEWSRPPEKRTHGIRSRATAVEQRLPPRPVQSSPSRRQPVRTRSRERPSRAIPRPTCLPVRAPIGRRPLLRTSRAPP